MLSALLVFVDSKRIAYLITTSFFVSTNPCPDPREGTRGKFREGSPACPDFVGAYSRYKYTPLPKAPTKLTPLHTPQRHSQDPVHLVGVFIISCINSAHHELLDTVLSFFGRFYMSKAKVERYIINYFKRSRNDKWGKNS